MTRSTDTRRPALIGRDLGAAGSRVSDSAVAGVVVVDVDLGEEGLVEQTRGGFGGLGVRLCDDRG